MSMSKAEDWSNNLPRLQDLIRRDPASYVQEFDQQLSHYHSQLEIFRLQPDKASKRFGTLVSFMAHVVPCYPTRAPAFADALIELLDTHFAILDPEVRRTVVHGLVLLRNRGVLEALPLFTICFKLFRCQDKELRALLFTVLVADVRNVNRKRRDHVRFNKLVQNFLFTRLTQDDSARARRKALDVLVELYRRQIWTDTRTVNYIAQACLSDDAKAAVGALRFFLGIDAQMAADEDAEEDEAEEDYNLVAAKGKRRVVTKQTRKRKRQAAREMALAKKKKRAVQDREPTPRFPAIEVIFDPQGFAEKVFRKLRRGTGGGGGGGGGSSQAAATARFEVRLLYMNLLSRLIGQHKLFVLNFYSYIQRYLNVQQQHLTRVLASFVQACHELVPPDELAPVLRHVADQFVNDRRPAEVIAIGLNLIKEVVARTPLLLEMPEIKPLVGDLVQYRKFREKGVIVAARGLINMIRQLHPAVLHKSYRGKEANMRARAKVKARKEAKAVAAAAAEATAAAGGADDAEAPSQNVAKPEEQGEEEEEEQQRPLPFGATRIATSVPGDAGRGSGDDDEDDDEDGEWLSDLDDFVAGGGLEEEAGGDAGPAAPAASSGGSTHRRKKKRKRRAIPDGTAVVAQYRNTEDNKTWLKWYPGKVERTNHNGTMRIKFDDGDVQDGTPPMRVRLPEEVAAAKKLRAANAERCAAQGEERRVSFKEQAGWMGEAMEDDDERRMGFMDADMLEGWHKKKKDRALERIEMAHGGKKGSDYGKKLGGGSTNREKNRRKNFTMIAHSHKVRSKLKRSLKQQQRNVNKAIKVAQKQGNKKMKRGRR